MAAWREADLDVPSPQLDIVIASYSKSVCATARPHRRRRADVDSYSIATPKALGMRWQQWYRCTMGMAWIGLSMV
jgi:hypothetical protein